MVKGYDFLSGLDTTTSDDIVDLLYETGVTNYDYEWPDDDEFGDVDVVSKMNNSRHRGKGTTPIQKGVIVKIPTDAEIKAAYEKSKKEKKEKKTLYDMISWVTKMNQKREEKRKKEEARQKWLEAEQKRKEEEERKAEERRAAAVAWQLRRDKTAEEFEFIAKFGWTRERLEFFKIYSNNFYTLVHNLYRYYNGDNSPSLTSGIIRKIKNANQRYQCYIELKRKDGRKEALKHLGEMITRYEHSDDFFESYEPVSDSIELDGVVYNLANCVAVGESLAMYDILYGEYIYPGVFMHRWKHIYNAICQECNSTVYMKELIRDHRYECGLAIHTLLKAYEVMATISRYDRSGEFYNLICKFSNYEFGLESPFKFKEKYNTYMALYGYEEGD